MALEGVLENPDHALVLDDVRFVVEPPGQGVHEAVISPVHRLIGPDGVGHMDVDWHPEFGTLLPNGVHPRVVGVYAGSRWGVADESRALIADLAHAARAGPEAPLELLCGRGAEAWLVESGVVDAAPELETIRVFGVHLLKRIEPGARCAGQDNGLGDPDLVHGFHPLQDLLRGSAIDVGVHVNGRILRLGDLGDRDLVDWLGAIILEVKLVRQDLRRGGAGLREQEQGKCDSRDCSADDAGHRYFSFYGWDWARAASGRNRTSRLSLNATRRNGWFPETVPRARRLA